MKKIDTAAMRADIEKIMREALMKTPPTEEDASALTLRNLDVMLDVTVMVIKECERLSEGDDMNPMLLAIGHLLGTGIMQGLNGVVLSDEKGGNSEEEIEMRHAAIHTILESMSGIMHVLHAARSNPEIGDKLFGGMVQMHTKEVGDA